MRTWSHDLVLLALAKLPAPVGSLVSAFPGRAGLADHPDWLEGWFLELVEAYANDAAPEEVTITVSRADEGEGDLAPLAKSPVKRDVRLVSIEPHFFRGFRTTGGPIRVDADLVVVEGRNSSGKTSLAEAIEWVFTGVLSRRASGRYGHPRELANCISNEFRPSDEETWVELVVKVDTERACLRRTLFHDYSIKRASEPKSILTRNGTELDAHEEAALLNEWFAGLHPILMQHTLRQFVHDQPSERRQYFECLLQIDELTELIARAVVGDATLEGFNPTSGSPALDSIRAFSGGVNEPQVLKRLANLDAADPKDAQDRFRSALVLAARVLFPDTVGENPTFSGCRDALHTAQASTRALDLPVLGLLRTPMSRELPDPTALEACLAQCGTASTSLATAKSAAKRLDESKLALAQAFDALTGAGVVSQAAEQSQECPLCLDPGRTLSPARIKDLASWTPLAKVLAAAEESFEKHVSAAATEIGLLQAAARNFVVSVPGDEQLAADLDGHRPQIRAAVQAVCGVAKRLGQEGERVAVDLGKLMPAPRAADSTAAPAPSGASQPAVDVGGLKRAFDEYRDALSQLEDLVGASARERSHLPLTGTLDNSFGHHCLFG